MELIKTEYSQSKGNGKLDKVLLKCEEPNYYELIDLLYTSQNEQAIIIKALYDYKINIVLKFGVLNSIEKEYRISQELLELPNFIRYSCLFYCNDDISNIINNKKTISEYKMCHYGTNPIGILVMKEYKLGCVENYDWNENNFSTLKNVIIQVIYSVLFAYETKGFIHGDLHSGNVLLKPKKNERIKYGDRTIYPLDVEVVIMDFEKSKLEQQNKNVELIRNINKFISSIVSGNNMRLNIDYDANKIMNLKSNCDVNSYYDCIDDVVNNMHCC